MTKMRNAQKAECRLLRANLVVAVSFWKFKFVCTKIVSQSVENNVQLME